VEIYSDLDPEEWTVVENRSAVNRHENPGAEGIKVAVDVHKESVKINADDIAQF
jgi:hypothetical protein